MRSSVNHGTSNPPVAHAHCPETKSGSFCSASTVLFPTSGIPDLKDQNKTKDTSGKQKERKEKKRKKTQPTNPLKKFPTFKPPDRQTAEEVGMKFMHDELSLFSLKRSSFLFDGLPREN